MSDASRIVDIELDNWSEFHEQVASIEEELGKLKTEAPHVSDVLFRGQADATWKLTSTLERDVGKEFLAEEYYRRALIVRREIEAFTGRSWDLPTPSEFATAARASTPDPKPLSAYEYMVHLRHHGFPSPLLDWSSSPYIAAFFAFRDPLVDTDRVAIFCCLGYAGSGKMPSPTVPCIYDLGPTLKTHARHFIQRCEYTYCTVERDGQPFYSSHEEAFGSLPGHDQDRLWRITLPRSERDDAMRWLDRVNITAYSLFRSEESLMESLAFRQFHLRA